MKFANIVDSQSARRSQDWKTEYTNKLSNKDRSTEKKECNGHLSFTNKGKHSSTQPEDDVVLAKTRIIQKDCMIALLGLPSQVSAAPPMHFKPRLAMTGKAAASHNWFNWSKHVGESSCFYEAHSPYPSSLLQALTISPKCC